MKVRDLVQSNSFPLIRYLTETELVRDLIITTVISGLASVLNYLFNIIAANQLPAESFSIMSGVVGLLYLIQIPALTIQTYFTKKSAGLKHIQLEELRATTRSYMIYGVLGVLIVFFLLPLLAKVTGVEIRYVVPVSIMIFASVFTPAMRGMILGLKRINLYNILSIVESSLRLLMFFLIIQISTDAVWPLWSYILPSMVVGLIAYISLRRSSFTNQGEDVLMKQENFGYLIVTLISFFLFNGLISLDLVLVDPSYRASYAALSLVGKIVYFASALATSVLFSYFANTKNRTTKRRYLYVGGALNLSIGFGLVYVFMVFGDAIHQAMFHGNYPEIQKYMVPLAIGMSFYSVTYLLLNYLLSDKRRGQILILLGIFLGQIILYLFRNDVLLDAVTNQIFLYATIAILILFYWAFEERRSINKTKLNRS